MAKIKWKNKEVIEQEKLEQEQLRLEEEQKKQAIEEAPANIQALQEEIMAVMMASAETYEQMYSENMSLMIALVDMYEEIQAMKGVN